MATSNARSMKEAGELLKEQAAVEAVAPQEAVKPGKKPMVEANAMDVDPPAPAGKKGEPAAAKAPAGKRKAAAEAPANGDAGAKRKQQPKGKAAAKPAAAEPAAAEPAAAEPEAEAAPAKKQKAAGKQPAAKKAGKAAAEAPAAEPAPEAQQPEAGEKPAAAKKQAGGKKQTAAAKKAAAAAEAEPAAMETDEPAAEAEAAPAKKGGKAAKRSAEAEAEPQPKQVKTSRGRTTAGVDYREKTAAVREQTVAVKVQATAESEAAAIEALEPAGRAFRLTDFAVTDEAGEQQPLTHAQLHATPLYASGVLFPAAGPLSKLEGQRVAKLGPIVGWRLAGQQVLLKTAAAEYTCVRAASSYRTVFAHISEQAELAHEVLKALSPSLGGNPAASLDEVIARLARAKVGKAYLSAREALTLNGRFVLQQLVAADAASVTSKLGGSAFAAALAEEVDAVERSGGGGGAIVINEPGSGAGGTDPTATLTDAERAGLDYARQVAARLDAQEARAANKRGGGAARGPAYIKISAAEIAEDYPDPAQYEKEGEEADELLLADEELFDVDPEALPRRLLKDFSIYDSEGMLSTLELLPMWGGAQPDAVLFASGVVVDDDGEWAGGQAVADAAGGSSSAAAAGGSSSADNAAEGGSAGAAASEGEAGMRIYLSQVQEWVVEFSCDMLLISLRTDVAWYRLDRPAAAYAPWFNVVLKSARVAVKALTLLSEESRASKLSFGDVVKRLAAAEKGSATYISDKADAVERFVVVHGQILLNQFAHFPVKAVRSSAFAAGLKARMELRRHAKLYLSKAKTPKQRSNANPMRDRACAKAKPMTATATVLVRGVWQSYFKTGASAPEGEEQAEAAPAAVEVAEDENEEDDEAAEEDALAVADARAAPAAADDADVEVVWGGAAVKRGGSDFYPRATIGGVEVAAGDVVALRGGSELAPPLGLVQALFQAKGGKKQVQLRTVVHGRETVLGDAAADDELFVTTELATKAAGSVARKVQATRLQRAWSLAERRAHLADDAARHERNAAAAAEERELEHVYRTLYVPEEGKFAALPADLAIGTLASEKQAALPGVALSADGKSLTEAGEPLPPGSFVFLRPNTLDQVEGAAGEEVELPEYAAKGRFCKGGANAGLRPYGIAQLLAVEPAAAGKKGKQAGAKARVRRFYRPEDVSADLAYTSDFRDVFASEEELTVDVGDVVARCRVAVAGAPADEETFVCRKTYRRSDGVCSEPPADLAPPAPAAAAKQAAGVADKGKGKGKASAASAAADASARQPTGVDDGISLASMDIFAGCGGLTEGFHQARAAHAKWAIEYERPAAEAFRLNHPDAVCWAENCNVILLAAMHKAGLADLCAGSEEAAAAAAKLPQSLLDSLPGPGEVEFLCGGPPCQGYSGMNRFNKGNWSMVQNSMVMAYLSFADFYRPRYFLLENVRNFVSHNKSFTFRLTLRSLLDMGYQVRFGVLNAGNFGVSQSRKRTFIWAAAPGERLPDWPRLQHIFHSPQLTINLPGNVKYTAVPQTEGAPLRTVTVRDVIADLPPIANGHDATEMAYSSGPQSAFQRGVRGGEAVLRDHICKEMNALNLERCRCIPKNQPGADWRVLEQIVKADPSRERFQGQPLVPWCLPHTAHRHNGWRGLFGRLAWGGHFPTSTTDPQPMGKVGQVFHPDQDRIVSVRECARAQGFPDSFRFYGTVHNKHRQIGNAVPPPLAAALGRRLRQALEATAAERQAGALQAQLDALA